VEGNEKLAFYLSKVWKKHSKVICIHKQIASSEHIESLIQEYKPDLVKVDIEGAEKHLLKVDRSVIFSVDEWLVETHSKNIFDRLFSFFSSIYKVKVIPYIVDGFTITLLHCFKRRTLPD